MKQDQASRRNKFMAIKPKAVSPARLVKIAYLHPDEALGEDALQRLLADLENSSGAIPHL